MLSSGVSVSGLGWAGCDNVLGWCELPFSLSLSLSSNQENVYCEIWLPWKQLFFFLIDRRLAVGSVDSLVVSEMKFFLPKVASPLSLASA